MIISIEFFFRIIGALLCMVGGGFLGSWLAESWDIGPTLYIWSLGLVGFLVGLILTPSFTIRPLRRTSHRLRSMPSEKLAAIFGGLFLGLVGAALLSLPLSLLGSPFRELLPIVVAVVFCYLSIMTLYSRQEDLKAFLSNMRGATSAPVPIGETVLPAELTVMESQEAFILLDTSVIIDGRIGDLSKTGFIRETLLVPNFVLAELQYIADSSDSLRRNRGRRGLEILRILQEESPVPTRITDMDVTEVRDVDNKLVALAKHLHCPVMTNDYNLNRVAGLQGVTVLNLNDLANAVKIPHLPGEELSIRIIQEGKEEGQGVGFLEDGTMVVVEEAEQLMNKTLDVTVTKVLQTAAGRMIFARP